MMESQRSDTEKINLIEEGKKQVLMKLLNLIKLLITVQSLKYKTMPSYCLKCKRNTENINSKV